MRRLPLDHQTADRLLAGKVAPDDAPPELADVSVLLRAASAETSPWELSYEAPTVAAMVTAVRSSISDAADPVPSMERRKPVTRFLKVKIAAITVGAVLAASAGLALAGALPDAAQDAVANVFEKAGITIPNSHADDAGKPEDADSKRENVEVHDAIEATEPGRERGALVSDAASDGKSHVPDSVPNGQNGGNEGLTGTERADEASEGRRSAGSENGTSGQDQRP